MADELMTTEYEDTDAVAEVEAEADETETKNNNLANALIGGALILTGYGVAKGTDFLKNRAWPWVKEKFNKGKDKAAETETEAVAEVEAEEVSDEEPKEEAPKKTKKK